MSKAKLLHVFADQTEADKNKYNIIIQYSNGKGAASSFRAGESPEKTIQVLEAIIDVLRKNIEDEKNIVIQ